MESGYLHANYARAFAALGTPRYLPEAEGWILQRPIPGTQYWDAMGCYPIFACRHWHKLGEDLAPLQQDIVSLTLVTEPLSDVSVAALRTIFPDVLRPYKNHFVVDLSIPHPIRPHHRRNVRQAMTHVAVELCTTTAALDEWVTLYQHLIERHNITGLAAFSRESLAAQWQVPGLTVLRAIHQSETVGMTLWFRDEERVYYHLAAYSPRGYELKASYALFHYAMEHFAQAGVRWMALGAGAGTENDGSDGLTRFKRGWATETRTVYLCGRIFQPSIYAALVGAQVLTSFFPAYRHPAITPNLTRSYAA
jgi:hypothetical protein